MWGDRRFVLHGAGQAPAVIGVGAGQRSLSLVRLAAVGLPQPVYHDGSLRPRLEVALPGQSLEHPGRLLHGEGSAHGCRRRCELAELAQGAEQLPLFVLRTDCGLVDLALRGPVGLQCGDHGHQKAEDQHEPPQARQLGGADREARDKASPRHQPPVQHGSGSRRGTLPGASPIRGVAPGWFPRVSCFDLFGHHTTPKSRVSTAPFDPRPPLRHTPSMTPPRRPPDSSF